MTTATLERQLKPLAVPLEGELLKRLYFRLPPRPITSKKMHSSYSSAVSLLMKALLEKDGLPATDQYAIRDYLKAVFPFVEEFEKKAFPLGKSSPEDMLRFLMDQNDLTQYDLAKELGGQPVVSAVLRGKRKLTREHIERLCARFHVSAATFYPAVS